jgi:TolB-like protein
VDVAGAAVAPDPDARAIAVLPFADAGADPENEYLSDGLTEELITALAKVEGLHVASRTSVFALKGVREDVRAIGARLGVSAVLEGSVRRWGSRLRVTAQLTDVRHGRTLWSERYDRELADVFALQDEIARTIVDTLRATLLGDIGDPVPVRYTANPRAYQLYLRGRHAWNRRTPASIAEGIRYFEAAIAEDPGYALAYTGLSDSYALQIDYRGSPVHEGLERARAEAQRALALDETLAEAHTSLAYVKHRFDWDWTGADTEFKRAIELNPRYPTARQWYALYLSTAGRHDEAVAEMKRALELDPLSPIMITGVGRVYHFAQDYDKAIEYYRKALEIDPSFGPAHGNMADSYVAKGMYPAAVQEMEEELTLAGRADRARIYREAFEKGGINGLWRKQLELLLAEAVTPEKRVGPGMTYVPSVALAFVYSRLGDTENTIFWLNRLYEERSGAVPFILDSEGLELVQDDPRYLELLRKVGFPQVAGKK